MGTQTSAPNTLRGRASEARRPTTSDLFLKLAKTERARRAKAENVFRRLRKTSVDNRDGEHGADTDKGVGNAVARASLDLKIAARHD